jgi:hypothetical protein
MSNLFAQWQDGTATDIETLRTLWSDLREVESDIAPLEAERQKLRDQISQVVAKTGAVELPGLGKAQITAGTVTKSYDRAALDELIIELTEQGYAPIAQQIAHCRRESMRAGSLRIEAERKK